MKKDRFEFCWIVDFPMYEWNEDDKKIDFSHNPFSMPNMGVEEFLALDPAEGSSLGEFARAAIGGRDRGPTARSRCQATVDAIAVRIVGNDEDPILSQH